MNDKDNTCPECGYESQSGDSESYGEQEYSTEFMCEECECQWTSYYKYNRKEIHKPIQGNSFKIDNASQFKGNVIKGETMKQMLERIHENGVATFLKENS